MNRGRTRTCTALVLSCLCLGWRAGLGAEAGAPESATSAAQVQPAHRDGSHDFDFEFGAWRARISRRLEPLTGSDAWTEYEGTSVVRKVWGGRANLGELDVEGPTGRIEGLSLRLYNPDTRQWSIHWASSRDGTLGEAMMGGFHDGIGEFYNQERYEGRPVYVRFLFSAITSTSFRLEQAFSVDGGKSWEPNWIATFER
jgi:hypothetical protein